MRSLILIAALRLIVAAQDKPPAGQCDVPDDAPLALVTGSKSVDLWKPSPPSVKFPVPAGHPVAIGKRDGEWTCVDHYGTGYGWMLTNRLRPIQPDLHPAAAAWIGVWTPLGWKKQSRDTVTKIVISTGATQGTLKVEGQAYWFGAVVKGERVQHEGAVEGEAQPEENRLRIMEGGCEVNLVLIGGFLKAEDNRQCGGMNVTFSGVWERTMKD
jgi:hypothetical protein